MGPESRDARGSWWGSLALGVAGLTLLWVLTSITRELGAASIPIWFMTIAGTAFVMRGPVGQAIARKISGEVPTTPLPAELPEELYAELDEMRARLAELEERQDFSERLLARREDPPAAG
jgi:hypothetical protein